MLSSKLPASASEIYYFIHAGGLQELEIYYRFHVDPTQADQAIDGLIADNNKILQRSAQYLKSSLPPPQAAKPYYAEGHLLNWWQPQTIRNGYLRGEKQSYSLDIWYDADKSLVYVSESD